jgi:hypothetical protein
MFLTVLAEKCDNTVARDVAKEYGHNLPQYDDASRAVSEAMEGARTITLISESQLMEDIQSLHRTFASVIIDIRLNLSDQLVQKIARYVEAIVPIIHIQVITINELFDKIKPHYSFLDCKLIEEIVDEFLSANVEIQAKLSQYMKKLEEFKKSSHLRHLKTAIEEALIPKQDITDTTCRVVIKLYKKHLIVYDVLDSTQQCILSHNDVKLRHI